jgi:hypothetical protein
MEAGNQDKLQKIKEPCCRRREQENCGSRETFAALGSQKDGANSSFVIFLAFSVDGFAWQKLWFDRKNSDFALMREK